MNKKQVSMNAHALVLIDSTEKASTAYTDIAAAFIYFNHTEVDGVAPGYMPYSEEETEIRAARVDDWYAKHPGIPMSKVFLAHFYEMSGTFLPHLKRWGCEFVCSMNPLDLPYPYKMTFGAPYFNKKLPRTLKSPVYYADMFPTPQYLEYEGRFFSSVTEIRDDKGYEWAPNNDVDQTIQHGINQISRALDGKVLSQLFTHESDFIRHIKPDRWKAIMKGITDYYASQEVRYATLDDALFYLRDLHQSGWIGSSITADGSITVSFEGRTLGPTEMAVYTDDETLAPRWHKVPPFIEACKVKIN